MLKGFHMLRKKILFEIIIIKSFKGIEIKCFNFEGTVYNKIKASDSIYKMIILLKIFLTSCWYFLVDSTKTNISLNMKNILQTGLIGKNLRQYNSSLVVWPQF